MTERAQVRGNGDGGPNLYIHFSASAMRSLEVLSCGIVVYYCHQPFWLLLKSDKSGD